MLKGAILKRRLRWLIFYAWNIPPIFGLGLIVWIGILQPSQILGILITPIEPAYILSWFLFSLWYLPLKMRPLADWLDQQSGSSPEKAQQAARWFPLIFWATFLLYLAIAPASVIFAAEIYTGFVSTPYDWFRIELVALIVSIIVGLPIFFLILDLFGQALGGMKLTRPIVTIRTKVFLIGALVPLLIETMLVQYYWTRTGFFTVETFGVWLLLEVLAIGGSMIFAHSFSQSLSPLQALAGVTLPLPEANIAALRARSTDEIGVLTADYRSLLEEQLLQSEILELNNYLLRSTGADVDTALVFQKVIELCCQAVKADQAFVLLYEQAGNELVGVIQTGSSYRAEGYYRLSLDEPSLAVWAFKQAQTVAVEDAQKDPRVSLRMIERFNIRATLASPLRVGDKVIGVLIGITHDKPRIYSAHDIAVIEGLAREASFALHSLQLSKARVHAETERFKHQEQYGLLLNSTAEGIFGMDNHGVCTFINPAGIRMLGYKRQEDIVGKIAHELFHHTHADGSRYPKVDGSVQLSKVTDGDVHSDKELFWRADGSSFPVELWAHPIRQNEKIEGVMVTFFDITERKKAEAELRIAATAFESQVPMIVTDAKSVILRINKAFTEATGYTADEVVGKTPRILQSGKHDKNFYRAMWESINKTGGWQGELWDQRKNGDIYPQWTAISAVKGDNGVVTNYISTQYDISVRKKAEEKINELAFYDQLTSLPNRTLLMDRLKQAISASSRTGNYGALLLIDLDNFKTLNDTLGHDMGDQLLIQVAQRLTMCVREGDTVARLGGDEFVVVLAELKNNEKDASFIVETVSNKILLALNETYQFGSLTHQSSASIGITLFKGDYSGLEVLLKQADLAMYESKKAGRNAMRFFNPEMQTTIIERAALEDELRKAIKKKQFLLHFQPQVLESGRVIGAEALVRWQHPQRGLVQPRDFIPLLEETRQILSLGLWVLENACDQLAYWETVPHMAHLTLAVNISASHLHQTDFVDQVLTVLAKAGANPQRLKLELTESLLVTDVEDAILKMTKLKEHGVGFSLDDFGTGFSSLSYLKRLPLDQLKIDQSFVKDILTDPNDAAIAKMVIALADSLGLAVIAEGVELKAQKDFLALQGCHAYQGYLFSNALTAEAFDEFVKQY